MGEDLLAKQCLDTVDAHRIDPAKGGETLRPSALVLSEVQGGLPLYPSCRCFNLICIQEACIFILARGASL